MTGSNQRLTFRDDSAARQGATIAFASHPPPPPPRTPNVKPLTSAAAAAALASTATRRHAEFCPMDPEPESGPEVGSVRDKIGRLNADSPTTADAVPSLSPAPEQIAARLAASPFPQRKPAPASDAAAIRSAARVQSQAPVDGRSLRSPTPIRPSNTKNAPLESLLQDDLMSCDRDSGIGHSPVQRSRASSLRDQALSPHPSVSSRTSSTNPHETKPKIPPRSMGPSMGSVRKPVSSGNPLRSPTPSMVSISGHPQNSNSSAVEESGGMNEESLSDAIVASSLASARASPTTVVPPPPPTRRRGRARSILHLTHSPTSDASRTPSPHKGMPHTLRGMPKVDDTDPHRRHRLLHKHPHKHHEGDRKRWRQEVTEKERRRYEGVWASNKGLLIPPERGNMRGPIEAEKWPPASECVLNLVVRDVWSRSRLPSSALEQVWVLVDHRQIGLLTREEFVVGMWLIDQQLKGHKLPVKVPESVWDSVRYATGIKLTSVTRG